ncbi:CaiB/BaiF CoA transferase family protein [Nocardioides sp.]|uniref:CaiB/BaiF CoA transferase family protein n=1 Tax=Nocardioides sp. TaxID=35761 RepID=UPI003D14D50B
MTGPLSGLKVLELGGLGAVPFAGMMLADLGADVLVADRPGTPAAVRDDPLRRGKVASELDLKSPGGRDHVLALVRGHDILLEGFRPGVTERMGLGPKDCHAVAPALVYGRMTGYGQVGPLAAVAGHDINFISMAGVLAHVGSVDRPPTLPLNLIADYAGGGMLLAFGVLAALRRSAATGKGDVVDAAMVDGASLLMTPFHAMVARGEWSLARGTNAWDGGAPYVQVYETKDHRYISVGAVEAHFYAALVSTLGMTEQEAYPQEDSGAWPARSARMAAIFGTRTRDEWVSAFDGIDACMTPVLDLLEASAHAHARARTAFVERDGIVLPASAPRFLSDVDTPADPARA